LGRTIAGVATIRIERRRTAWTDRLRAYNVAVDDEVVGRIRHCEESTSCRFPRALFV